MDKSKAALLYMGFRKKESNDMNRSVPTSRPWRANTDYLERWRALQERGVECNTPKDAADRPYRRKYFWGR